MRETRRVSAQDSYRYSGSKYNDDEISNSFRRDMI